MGLEASAVISITVVMQFANSVTSMACKGVLRVESLVSLELCRLRPLTECSVFGEAASAVCIYHACALLLLMSRRFVWGGMRDTGPRHVHWMSDKTKRVYLCAPPRHWVGAGCATHAFVTCIRCE